MPLQHLTLKKQHALRAMHIDVYAKYGCFVGTYPKDSLFFFPFSSFDLDSLIPQENGFGFSNRRALILDTVPRKFLQIVIDSNIDGEHNTTLMKRLSESYSRNDISKLLTEFTESPTLTSTLPDGRILARRLIDRYDFTDMHGKKSGKRRVLELIDNTYVTQGKYTIDKVLLQTCIWTTTINGTVIHTCQPDLVHEGYFTISPDEYEEHFNKFYISPKLLIQKKNLFQSDDLASFFEL